MAEDWDINIDFAAYAETLRERLPRALVKGMEHVHTQTTPRVPVETGQLAGSGGVTFDGEQASLTYPGPYALYQHEGVYYRHGRYGPPLRHTHGESFFLQRTVVEEAPTVIGIIEQELFGE